MIALAAAAFAAPPTAREPTPRDLPGVAGGAAELEVAVTVDGVTCRFARGRVTGEAEGRVRIVLGALGEATARWAEGQGPLSLVADDAGVPACELPPIVDVRLPAPWAPISLRRPATEVLFDASEATVAPFGEDGRAWQVSPPAGRALPIAFAHADQPPTRLRVRLDPEAGHPDGRRVEVGLGEVARVPVEGAPRLATEGGAHARFLALSSEILVLGAAPGEEATAFRAGDAPPEALIATVGPASRAAPQVPVFAVAPGGSRRIRPDRPLAAVHVARPEIAGAELRGSRLKLTGLGAGFSDLVLVDVDGVAHVIRVAVP